jgi:hypothetical protein
VTAYYDAAGRYADVANPARASIAVVALADGFTYPGATSQKAYLFQDGRLISIPTSDALAALGFAPTVVRVVPDALLSSVPAPPSTGRDQCPIGTPG